MEGGVGEKEDSQVRPKVNAKDAAGPSKFAVRSGLTAAGADVGVVHVKASRLCTPGSVSASDPQLPGDPHSKAQLARVSVSH